MTAFNLLISTAENGVGRIVLAGSFEEPDDVNSAPCSPYADAKWSASGYARMFQALYQVPVVNRKFQVYGSIGLCEVNPLRDYIAFARGSAQVEPRRAHGRLDLCR